MKWISVKERLPNKNQEVLVSTTGLVLHGTFKGVRYRKPRWVEGYYGQGTLEPISRVTHWMPLPEPPKTEDVEVRGERT